MTEKLTPIKYDKELSAFDLAQTDPCTDRLITKLVLDDYDWMNYQFTVWLPTKTQGFLEAKAEYYGFTNARFLVSQKIADKKYIHEIEFDADLFVEFLKKFMAEHLKHWDNTYAFCGEEMAVEFYNKILENAVSYEIREDNSIKEAYVVMEHVDQGEYTEGHYYTSAEKASTPVAAFSDKKKAEEECERLNRETAHVEPDDADWYRNIDCPVPNKTPEYAVAAIPAF